jgi:hypothetical protein
VTVEGAEVAIRTPGLATQPGPCTKIVRSRTGVEMAKSEVSLVAVVVAAVTVIATGGASARSTAPPSGLTNYGRVVWNLDALLHDTFGRHDVYLSIPQKYPRTPRNFSTVSGPNCCSAYYLPTFKDASGSAFKLFGPTKPPKPAIGASGGEVPLTIKRSYIYCGRGNWLFEHYGNGPANWQIGCHR